VYREIKVSKEIKETKEIKVGRVYKAPPDSKAIKVIRVGKDCRD
jgi:hypothetical protein